MRTLGCSGLATERPREALTGWTRCPHHVTTMDTYADVAELLANAKRARAMAAAACSPESKRMLADIAADYESLASCKLTILETQQCLADCERLLGEAACLG
jgi:hypothetical protein